MMLLMYFDVVVVLLLKLLLLMVLPPDDEDNLACFVVHDLFTQVSPSCYAQSKLMTVETGEKKMDD